MPDPQAMKMPEPAATEDGFSNAPFPGSAAFDKLQADAADAATDNAPKADAPKADDTPPAAEEPNAGMPTAEQELAAIRAEGLTGASCAWRAASRRNTGLRQVPISTPSVFSANAGSIPSRAAASWNLWSTWARKPPQARPRRPVALCNPRPRPARHAAHDAARAPRHNATTRRAPQPISADDRAAEIMKVQRDIARRRRKRLVLLATRLTFFVLLPTLWCRSTSTASPRRCTPPIANSSSRRPKAALARRGRRSRRSSGRLGLCHGAGKHHGAGLPRKPRGDAAPR
jgi:capsular polysaccharide transport system permease protein